MPLDPPSLSRLPRPFGSWQLVTLEITARIQFQPHLATKSPVAPRPRGCPWPFVQSLPACPCPLLHLSATNTRIPKHFWPSYTSACVFILYQVCPSCSTARQSFKTTLAALSLRITHPGLCTCSRLNHHSILAYLQGPQSHSGASAVCRTCLGPSPSHAPTICPPQDWHLLSVT